MLIHNKFTGGNGKVKEQAGDTVYIENELRDTVCDWFYFAFCVEGAEGREIRFRFQKNRIGYFGPAVSHDLESWHWLGKCDGDGFTYKFGENESRVYFAHNMLYHPKRLYEFAERSGIEISELCKSKKGRSVPCIRFGDGSTSLILTARHHACEATGSYVLEGVLKELFFSPIPEVSVFCVPFVDFDGVTDGDQGKERYPHDHNRDYTADAPSIHPEVRAIRDYAEKNGCNLAFDLHAPWHKGGRNDHVFIVRNCADKNGGCAEFSEILEGCISDGSMKYSGKNDHPAFEKWNVPSPNFSFTMANRPECSIAFTLETTYFGSEGNAVSEEKLLELGRCFALAIKEYCRTHNLKQ